MFFNFYVFTIWCKLLCALPLSNVTYHWTILFIWGIWIILAGTCPCQIYYFFIQVKNSTRQRSSRAETNGLYQSLGYLLLVRRGCDKIWESIGGLSSTLGYSVISSQHLKWLIWVGWIATSVIKGAPTIKEIS